MSRWKSNRNTEAHLFHSKGFAFAQRFPTIFHRTCSTSSRIASRLVGSGCKIFLTWQQSSQRQLSSRTSRTNSPIVAWQRADEKHALVRAHGSFRQRPFTKFSCFCWWVLKIPVSNKIDSWSRYKILWKHPKQRFLNDFRLVYLFQGVPRSREPVYLLGTSEKREWPKLPPNFKIIGTNAQFDLLKV